MYSFYTYLLPLSKNNQSFHTNRRYRLVVFNGVRSFANVSTGGLEVCALVFCSGDSLDDCGALYPNSTSIVTPTSFDSLIITRRADLERRSFFGPSTLTRDYLPMDGDEFAYLASGHSNSSLLLMYLVRPSSDVLTFGIYGRRFDRDGGERTRPPQNGAATATSAPSMLVGLVALVLLRCYWSC